MIKGKNINTKLEVNDNLKVFLFRNNIAFGTTTLNQLKSQGIFGNQIAITSDTKVYCIYKNKADYLDFSFIQSNLEFDIKVICYSPKVGYGYVNNNDVFISAELPLGYGLLYNRYAATDARGVAPSGFRIPSAADLTTLVSNTTADSIKSIRSDPDPEPSWNNLNISANNNSGFTAFGAGDRRAGIYSEFKNIGTFWSSDAGFGPADQGRCMIVSSLSDLYIVGETENFRGHSIRCVADTEPSTLTVQDADGNNYSWVQIGSQYWLQQSLKTTTYNNGDPIPTGLDDTAWSNTTDGAWAYPNGDSSLPI